MLRNRNRVNSGGDCQFSRSVSDKITVNSDFSSRWGGLRRSCVRRGFQ